MAKFEVCVLETRELIFEVEAKNSSEAEEFVHDMDTSDAVRDSYSGRTIEWIDEL